MSVCEHIISDGTFVAPSRATSAFRVRPSVSNTDGKAHPSAFEKAKQKETELWKRSEFRRYPQISVTTRS